MDWEIQWGLGGQHGGFYGQKEPIRSSLLNNAKVKRNENYGGAVWQYRSHAILRFPPSPSLGSRRQDHRAYCSSLFTSLVGSKNV